jgi:hypothetical protein
MLTDRDLQLLTSLGRAVRVLTLDQIAGRWFASSRWPARAAARRLTDLVSAGYLQSVAVMLHPLLDVRCALYEWAPEQGGEPCFGPIAWRLRSRFRLSPIRTAVFSATREAARLCGDFGAPRFVRGLAELLHDVHVGQLWLDLTARDATSPWVHEDQLAATAGVPDCDGKLPDAVVGGRLIEFGGRRYDVRKLRRLHAAYCHLPYSIY